jgi:hypothetical protein
MCSNTFKAKTNSNKLPGTSFESLNVENPLRIILASEQLGKSANSGLEVEHRLPTAGALENQIHQQRVL